MNKYDTLDFLSQSYENFATKGCLLIEKGGISPPLFGMCPYTLLPFLPYQQEQGDGFENQVDDVSDAEGNEEVFGG